MTEIKNDRLRTLKAKAEAAGRRFEEGKNRLYRNGQQLFAEDVHREEMEKLAKERNAVLLAVEEEVREMSRNSGNILERLQNADPSELLSEDELARANARRPFARDAAEVMDLDSLRMRLESVLESGDKANIFAHLVAGRSRKDSIVSRRREKATTQAGTPAAGASVTSSTQLDEVLGAMEKALGGEKRDSELEATRALGAEAGDVEATANKLRYEGRSQAQVWAQQNLAVPGPDVGAAREEAREMERLAKIK